MDNNINPNIIRMLIVLILVFVFCWHIPKYLSQIEETKKENPLEIEIPEEMVNKTIPFQIECVFTKNCMICTTPDGGKLRSCNK